jgi:hypothetical protein
MTKYQIQHESWWNQYFYSYYWSIIIIVTIGFGDITAANPI